MKALLYRVARDRKKRDNHYNHYRAVAAKRIQAPLTKQMALKGWCHRTVDEILHHETNLDPDKFASLSRKVNAMALSWPPSLATQRPWHSQNENESQGRRHAPNVHGVSCS